MMAILCKGQAETGARCLAAESGQRALLLLKGATQLLNKRHM